MPGEQLRLIPRIDFATRYFPQSSCTGCYFLKTCTALLSASHVQMVGDFWLVRGENGECGRRYSEPMPLDLQMFRQREIRRLYSMSGGATVGAIAKRRTWRGRD